MASIHKRGRYWMIRWRDANGVPKGETIKLKSHHQSRGRRVETGQLQVQEFLDGLEDKRRTAARRGMGSHAKIRSCNTH